MTKKTTAMENEEQLTELIVTLVSKTETSVTVTGGKATQCKH